MRITGGHPGTVQGEDPCTGTELGRSVVFERQWKERWPEHHDQEAKGWAGLGWAGAGGAVYPEVGGDSKILPRAPRQVQWLRVCSLTVR